MAGLRRFEGGCLCGAPAVARATWRGADFAWTRGRPVEHRSSAPVVRAFCGESLPLEDHIWTADGLSWMQHDDGWPHHRQRRSDT